MCCLHFLQKGKTLPSSKKKKKSVPFGEIEQLQILTIRLIIKGVRVKHTEETVLFVFDSIHKGKMKEVLLIYDLCPKNTAAMVFYKNTKALVRSLDGDTDFFKIVAGVWQEDILAPCKVYNLPSLCTKNVNRYDKRKCFKTKKKKTKRRNYEICRRS